MNDATTPPASLTQTDLVAMQGSGRLGEQPLVIRTIRRQLGGGFGNPTRHPYTWVVQVQVDGEPHRILSARGAERAWTSLDRLERWLREQGFHVWAVINELEPSGPGVSDGSVGDGESLGFGKPSGLK